MRALELKIPPVLQVLIVGAAMWGLAWLFPILALPAPFKVFIAPGFSIGFAIAGVAIAVAGVVAFRRARTTVDPMHPDRTSAIVTSGVYGLTRNPMYLGMAMVLTGFAVWLANLAAFAGPVVFLFWMTRFQIIPEERALAAQFGNAYADYRRKVRRWI